MSPDVDVEFVGELLERSGAAASGDGVGVAATLAVVVEDEAAGFTLSEKSAPLIVPLMTTPAVPATSTPATSAPLPWSSSVRSFSNMVTSGSAGRLNAGRGTCVR